ncbi:MAG: hypothetical protein IJY72_06190, partial [Akkermansia sp.]|nr:hypothetical protein [Akkermansia sp.]
MKHFFPLILLLLSSIGHAQWPAERKQAYDAAAPQEPEMQTPATYLSMRPAGDIRLTTTSSTPFDLVENISLASLPNELNLQAWRGERCSTQLAVQANGLARQLSVSCTSLSNGEKCIPATVSLIRYTVAHGTPTADIIGGETTCDNPAGVNRGIWVQIDVPQNASPGIYQGQVIVSAEGCAETRQTIRMHVSEETLPA